MIEKVPTLGHPPVEVDANAFFDAVSKIPKMKRGPIGSKGLIPQDTRLYADANGIMVETPVMTSLVLSSAPWRINVSVDSRMLVDVCTRFKAIDAFKGPKPTFQISVADNQLKVKWQATAISVPLFR